ncbi:MAG: type II toxin-antitoxin system RelE/ParE family toxin [Rhodospirillaceae bacterium]|nr:type II toxin-antitoxin system RelE/ParE family toxin [Rhodospirillaceae bacterium]MBT5666030.1 type II toxin-antitoxin system RelE/ParE family toxin [Rhodospirillaceae bacterium]
MNIKFSRQAETDLDNIRAYIAQHNEAAADSVIQRILQSIAVLENFPLLGRDGQVDGTREFPISNLRYFAVYRIVDAAQITVITVMHSSRQYPPAKET